MARTPPSPELVAQVLERHGRGESDEAIAGALGIGARTVRRWRAERGDQAAASSSAPAEPPPATDVPPGLTGEAADLWIIDHEITATRGALREARAKDRTHGLAALGKLLADLLKRRQELRPPAPPTENEEEQRWRGDADAVLRKIRAGLARTEAA